MNDLLVTAESDVAYTGGYPAPYTELVGTTQARMLGPGGVSLWLVEARFGERAILQWDGVHGDEMLYVADGHLTYDDRSCPSGGVVIVEASVPARIDVAAGSRVLHFGPIDPQQPEDGLNGPPDTEGHCVHLVGPGGTFAMVQPGRETRFFADSTCPTCRSTLMYTARASKYASDAHSHSEDEIIHLVSGVITVGKTRLGPGDTLFVGKNRRYRFESGDDGFGFLNYRRDASMYAPVRTEKPVKEGGAAHGFTFVNDVR